MASLAVEGRDIRSRCEDPDKGCISVPDLQASPVRVIFGTIFTAPAAKDSEPDPCLYADITQARQTGLRQLEVYEALQRDGLARLNHGVLELPEPGEPLVIHLLMEGADPIDGPEDVAWWRSRGLRMVGLTWSCGTRYAGGNECEHGLTTEGRELVAALDESGIVHDASHCSDRSLEDLLDSATGTIVATHSNSRTLIGLDNQRFLSDDHARAILDRGGVIGLNLFTRQVRAEGRATMQDCIEHVLHFCELAGNRTQVALGSDADGGFTPELLPIGLEHPSRFGQLLHGLAESGFSEAELAGFAHGNWIRCLAGKSA